MKVVSVRVRFNPEPKKGATMNYVGVDIHKRYSFVSASDEQGNRLREARIEGNAPSAFAQFFAGLDGSSKVVLEACWNWGLFHDVLEELEPVEEIVLAHPFKTRKGVSPDCLRGMADGINCGAWRKGVSPDYLHGMAGGVIVCFQFAGQVVTVK